MPLSRHVSAFAILAAVLAFAYGSLRAQQPSPSTPAGAAEFTITVDFQAVSPTGQPIADLTPDEITIRIDGKPRTLRSLQFVTYAGGTAAAGVPPAFGSNESGDRVRAIVIVIDDESIPVGQERKLRDLLSAFIDELPVRDQVALVKVPHGGMVVDLTKDRDRLHRAIKEIAPITATTEAPCQAKTILRTLSGLFDSVSRGDQPITVAYVSSTLFGFSQLSYGQRPSPTGGGLPTEAGACQVQNEDFEAVGRAAAGARAQFYVVHPDYSMAAVQAGIENLRGVTGAPLFHLSAGGEPGLTRVAREASGYYLATFDALRADRKGMAYDISVKSSRRNVEVRSRPKIVIGTDLAGVVPSGAPYTPREMVRTTRPFRDLPLRTAGFASRPRGGGDSVNVVALFESVDKGVTLTGAAAGLFDSTGRLVAQWNAAAGEVGTPGRLVALAMSAPPGAYRLRVAAVDASGRIGAVDTDVEAELAPAGPLRLSSLMLGLSRDDKFSPRLQFTTETTAIAYLEVYDGKPGTQVMAMFELARSANGPALMQFPAGLDATSEPGRFLITTTIPVGGLPPGDYVIRGIIGLEGQAAGRVIRTLHKTGG
jgi:hypothetical protein